MKQLTIFCCLILVLNHAAHANSLDSGAIALTKQDTLSLQIDYLMQNANGSHNKKIITLHMLVNANSF